MMPAGLEGLFLGAMFVFGLAFGSFANVIIWRSPRGESLSSPPSHCPACDRPIRWRDNIPVLSWLLLRGRCRDCGAPISPRYPAIELLTALLWLACGVRFGFGAQAFVAAFMCYLLLILSAIDLDVLRLPNALVAILGLVGLVAVAINQFLGIPGAPLTPATGALSAPLAAAVVGGVAASGISLGIAMAYQGVRGRAGFGMGDVKLLLALGPYLGIYNIGVLFLGSIIGAVWGILAASRSKEGLSAKIPFGPSLAAAAVVLAFAGPSLWGWYAGVVGLN